MFCTNDEAEDWCTKNFLWFRVLSEAAKVRDELLAIATQLEWRDEEENLSNPGVQLHCLGNLNLQSGSRHNIILTTTVSAFSWIISLVFNFFKNKKIEKNTPLNSLLKKIKVERENN